MAATIQPQQAGVGRAGRGVAGARSVGRHQPTGPRLTTEQVWQQLAKASFAVLGHVTLAGEPRSSGVVYKTVGRRLYVAVCPDSWKAKHVAASGRVPVRRGGILSLLAPIPPATVSFYATAMGHPAGSPQARSRLSELGSLIPAERQALACLIEVVPEGAFVTYGLGVSFSKLRDPAAARAHVPVTPEGRTR